MRNDQYSALLNRIADLLEIRGEVFFKVRSYREAARQIDELGEPIDRLRDEGRLDQVHGIGKAIADKLAEYGDTGNVEYLASLESAVPPGLLDFLRIPGLGPRTAKDIYDALGITTLEGLEEALNDGRLRKVPRIRARAEENIQKGLDALKGHGRGPRTLLPKAMAIADQVVSLLQPLPGVERISLAGSLLIEHPGFSWAIGTDYRIGATTKPYSVRFNQTTRIIQILNGDHPFLPGTTGTIRVELSGQAAFELKGASAVVGDVSVGSGVANVFAYAAPLVSGTAVSFSQIDLTSSTGYIRWSGSNTRIGGDASSIQIDSPSSNVTWRDSSAGYAAAAALYSVGFQVSAGRILRSGFAATGARPSATTAGAAAMFYDSTLGKPIWSNGTVWKDATGTTV